jgi:hypothetical protein
MATSKLRDALVKKTSWNKQQLSSRVRLIRNALPVSTAQAQAVVAHQQGIKIDRFLDDEELRQVREVIAKLGVSVTPAAHASTKTNGATGARTARAGVRATKRTTGAAARTRAVVFPGLFTLDHPLLPESKLHEAQEMAGLYPLLYVIENSMREVTQRVMRAKYGIDWWNTALTSGKMQSVKQNAAQRQAGETKMSWHQRRGAHDIDYIDFSELRDIILAKQDDFFPDVLGDNRAWFEQFMRELLPSRNVVCHMNPLAQHNVDDVVRVKARRWLMLLSERQAHIPAP